jgi:hypothetical protein
MMGGVGNGPSANTQFTLSKSYMITEILNYHWNNGKGAAPGTIKLVDGNGKVYGPWNTTGLVGSGGIKNCNWQCNPNIILPAGTYIVIDSNPATWSCNGGSDNAGFTRVFGYESNAEQQEKKLTEKDLKKAITINVTNVYGYDNSKDKIEKYYGDFDKDGTEEVLVVLRLYSLLDPPSQRSGEIEHTYMFIFKPVGTEYKLIHL